MSVSDRVNHHNRAARQIRLIVHLLYSESVEIILLLLVTKVEGLSSNSRFSPNDIKCLDRNMLSDC